MNRPTAAAVWHNYVSIVSSNSVYRALELVDSPGIKANDAIDVLGRRSYCEARMLARLSFEVFWAVGTAA